MKTYDVLDSNGSILVSVPDSQWPRDNWDQQLGTTVVQREATYDESLAECYRLRQAAYDAQCPIADQLDADWHARQGDPSKQQALDAVKAAIKAQYPKPVQS